MTEYDTLSVFELFSVGIGPSSSHSVGPMRAARLFALELGERGDSQQLSSLVVRLFGSLGLTGKGHGTDKAVLLGLQGEEPDTLDVETVDEKVIRVVESHRLLLADGTEIEFDPEQHLLFLRKESLPFHPNGIEFSAFDAAGDELLRSIYYSVGGGFVVNEKGDSVGRQYPKINDVPFPFRNGADLLRIAEETGLCISDIMLANEGAYRAEAETRRGILDMWQVMKSCVKRGCEKEGLLPGGLNIQRRAPNLYRQLNSIEQQAQPKDPLTTLDWVNLWAMAVNEENACGGRVVTAPTNGAAGVIPATLHYLEQYLDTFENDTVVRFFLTAAAIGMLYKLNASISGADVGCQGEVGVACSMAAGALAEALGGSVLHVEEAAEIGMEHNLGLTCDPIGGLVQVPCIERNAMGATKAINAARLALMGDGTHHVSLDRVIATMKRTGADMSTKYKETSRGGLAVNIPEC